MYAELSDLQFRAVNIDRDTVPGSASVLVAVGGDFSARKMVALHVDLLIHPDHRKESDDETAEIALDLTVEEARTLGHMLLQAADEAARQPKEYEEEDE